MSFSNNLSIVKSLPPGKDSLILNELTNNCFKTSGKDAIENFAEIVDKSREKYDFILGEMQKRFGTPPGGCAAYVTDFTSDKPDGTIYESLALAAIRDELAKRNLKIYWDDVPYRTHLQYAIYTIPLV